MEGITLESGINYFKPIDMISIDEYGGCNINGDYYSEDYIFDLIRLQKALFKEESLIATLEECANIWQRYSNDICASWLFFPENDDSILDDIRSSDYFDSFENYSL